MWSTASFIHRARYISHRAAVAGIASCPPTKSPFGWIRDTALSRCMSRDRRGVFPDQAAQRHGEYDRHWIPAISRLQATIGRRGRGRRRSPILDHPALRTSPAPSVRHLMAGETRICDCLMDGGAAAAPEKAISSSVNPAGTPCWLISSEPLDLAHPPVPISACETSLVPAVKL